MKRILFAACFLVFYFSNSFGQQIGSGYATEINNFGDILLSGTYNGLNPSGGIPDNTYWHHLFVIRHANASNNHQFQLSTAFTENDRLFFRKIAAGLEPRSPQWFELATRGGNTFNGNQVVLGNLGIGTTDPGSALLKLYKSELPSFELASSVSRLEIGIATSEWSFAPWTAVGDIVFRPLGPKHGIVFSLPNDNNDGNSYIKFGDNANGNWVGIFNNRQFRVDGTMIATKIMVKTDVWSDYVFNSDYKLKSLNEIESYIKDHKHLPDLPSANEVIAEGIDVAKMNSLLLKKIEELTLLMIEQNKMIQILQNKVSELEK